MRRSQSIDDAKAIYREEKNKFVAAAKAVAGSRILIALFMTCALAFSSALVIAPDRLPSFGGLSVVAVGLPEGLDFGATGEAAKEIRAAAERQGAKEEAQGFVAENPELVPAMNWIGLGGSLGLLVLALMIQAEQRKRAAAAVV